MNYHLMMLRGKVDKRTQKVCSLVEHTDMWTHLAANMFDYVQILYWGGNRTAFYNGETEFGQGVEEKWVPNFKEYKHNFIPDIIFARGGFPEYHHILNNFNCYKIYYGAGTRFMPDRKDYNLVLVDTYVQKEKVSNKHPKMRVLQWLKPAWEGLFYPRKVKKEYDVCYVANGQQSDIKNIKWIYNTIPNHLRVLHLGYPSKYTPPKNVDCRRVERSNIADWMCKCSIGIVPYTKYDSGPRVIPEMLACGLPVIVLKETRFNEHYFDGIKCGEVREKSDFWCFKPDFAESDRIHSHFIDNFSIKIISKWLKLEILKDLV